MTPEDLAELTRQLVANRAMTALGAEALLVGIAEAQDEEKPVDVAHLARGVGHVLARLEGRTAILDALPVEEPRST